MKKHPTQNFAVKYLSHQIFIHSFPIWRRRWHPTPVLLPGKSHGWRRLMGCSPWGREESDTTERLNWTELNPHFDTAPITFAFLLFLTHDKHTPASKLLHILSFLSINTYPRLTPDALMALSFTSPRSLSIQLQSYLDSLKGLIPGSLWMPKTAGEFL